MVLQWILYAFISLVALLQAWKMSGLYSGRYQRTTVDPEVNEGIMKKFHASVEQYTLQSSLGRYVDNQFYNTLTNGLSQLTLYALLELFSTGDTYEQLKQVVKLDKAQLMNLFPNGFNHMYKKTHNKTLIFRMTTKIFCCKKCKLTPSFINIAKNHFYADIEQHSRPCVQEISRYIECETHGQVGHPPSLYPLTIYNTVYLRVLWQMPFNPQQSLVQNFIRNHKRGTITLPYLYQENLFLYLRDDYGTKFLQLNIQTTSFSFLLLLPATHNLYDAMVNYSMPLSFSTIQKSLGVRRVKVYIPKFSMDNMFTMRPYMYHKKFVKLNYMFYDRGLYQPKKNGSIYGIKGPQLNEEFFAARLFLATSFHISEAGIHSAGLTEIPSAFKHTSRPRLKREPTYVLNATRPFAFFLVEGSSAIMAGFYTGESTYGT